MKNFLFFKAFYEGNAHYLCDFYEAVAEDGNHFYEISVEASGKHFTYTILKTSQDTWKVEQSEAELNASVEDKLLTILKENLN